MKVLPFSDIKSKFINYLMSRDKEPIVITQNHKKIAMLLFIEDEDEMERLELNYSPEFKKIIRESKDQISNSKGIAHEEFWKELED